MDDQGPDTKKRRCEGPATQEEAARGEGQSWVQPASGRAPPSARERCALELPISQAQD